MNVRFSRPRGGAGGRRRQRAAEEEPPSRERRATDRGLLTRTGAGPRAPGPGGGRASPHTRCLSSSSQRSPRRRGECTPLLSRGSGSPRFQTTAVSFVCPVSGTPPPPPRTRMQTGFPPLPFPAPSQYLGSLELVLTGRKGREGTTAAPNRGGGSPETFSALQGSDRPAAPGCREGEAALSAPPVSLAT